VLLVEFTAIEPKTAPTTTMTPNQIHAPVVIFASGSFWRALFISAFISADISGAFGWSAQYAEVDNMQATNRIDITFFIYNL
jgi:hypothetical protein